MSEGFGFKELKVWQRAVDFAVDVIDLTENLNTAGKHFRLIEQVEAASASVAANIAEGKGRLHPKEFRQFLYVARGSMYETVTFLNVFQRKNWITQEKLKQLELEAEEIVKMIKGLINSIKIDK